MKCPTSVRVDLTDTNWKLLRRQKALLYGPHYAHGIKQELADGLLSFIDHIQDSAAEQIGEKAVFGKKNNA